jgi:hypothetical protein
MIDIDSEKGHIGNFWWINSNQSEFYRTAIDFAGFHVHLDFINWGTCGFGMP